MRTRKRTRCGYSSSIPLGTSFFFPLSTVAHFSLSRSPIPASLARTAASLIPPPSTSLPVASSSSSSASQPPLKRLKSTSPDLERRGGFGGGGFGKSKEKDDGDLKFGDVLKCFRVNMNELKKRNEYQVRPPSPRFSHSPSLSSRLSGS